MQESRRMSHVTHMNQACLTHMQESRHTYKIIGLFCKIALQKRLYSAKETYNLKEKFSKVNVTRHRYKRKESRDRYERVTSYVSTSHVTHTNTSLDPGDTRKAWRQKQLLSDSRQYSQAKILKSQLYHPFT